MLFENLGLQSVLAAKRQSILKDQTKIAQRAQDFRAFYEDNFEEIKIIIHNELLNKTFTKETLETIRLQHLNILKKPLNRKTAGIYDNEPKRQLVFEKESVIDEDGNKKEVESELSKKQNELLQEMLNKFDYANKVKEALRRSEFFNICLAMPTYREDTTEELKYSIDLLLPDEYVPVTGRDFLALEKIAIERLDEEKQIYYLVFTKDENYVMDVNGEGLYTNKKEIEGRKKEDFENVYKDNGQGVIPIAILRKNIGGDFWGEPNWNLYNAQLETDIALTDLRHSETFQHFGVYWGINTNQPSNTVFSPNSFIDFKVDDPNLPRPELNCLVPNVNFALLRENIDWRIDKAQNLEGIPSASTSRDVNDLSGYSKEIDEGELNEMRELAKGTLYKFELMLMKYCAIVWNYHQPATMQLDLKNGKFECEFSEEKPHEDITSKKARREMESEWKINTPIDFIMEDKEVSRAEAELIYQTNKTFYDKLSAKPLTAMERILNGGNGIE